MIALPVKKEIRRRKIRWIRVLFIASGLILPLIHFAATYLYTNAQSFLMAFYKTVDGQRIWTFEHFETFFGMLKEPMKYDLGLAFFNTFRTFGITTLMFPIGIFVNYFL